jgi:hypothetical protein
MSSQSSSSKVKYNAVSHCHGLNYQVATYLLYTRSVLMPTVMKAILETGSTLK